MAPISFLSRSPQPFVDKECLGVVSAADERLHEQPVAALAVRREFEQSARVAIGRSHFGAANTQARRSVTLYGPQSDVLEPPPSLDDPRRVFTGKEPAVRNPPRDCRRSDPAGPVLDVDGRLCLVDLPLGDLKIDRGIRRRYELKDPAPCSPTKTASRLQVVREHFSAFLANS